ncbi:serine hydrolase [Streptomyces sp. NPDC089799]|uniref:serine hydrolase n=1 Tax=Streptomyces sp. NPDC089799 TaxID=3155066 RepID=UPI003426C93B
MAVLRTLGAAGVALVLAAGPAAAAPSPPPAPKPQITDAEVDAALRHLDAYVAEVMKRTGVPGISVAVVYRDRVVHLKGYGVRRAGDAAAVGPDTVFQLASLSKPVSSTVVAAGMTDPAGWERPVELPGFALKDPWVSRHVTTADLFAHRSGLPDHAGDLLEDLGYDRNHILGRLRLEPLTAFRASYAYTNFGLTAAAEAVARQHGVSWQKLNEDLLFKPAGMSSTSTTFAAFEKAANKAVTHVRNPDGTWSARYVRDPDAQAPAGGVSSTARDMARWMRLQLGNGVLDGRRIVGAAPLEATHAPTIVSRQPSGPAGTPGFYGLGWNVSYDDAGRLRLSHTGAFELGANTNVTMLPLEQLGIVVLTNGAPVGQADAIALDFFDTAEHGRASTDWLALAASLYAQQLDEAGSSTDYTKPPAGAAPARPDSAYTGTYDNAYYGKLTVTAREGAAPGTGLTLSLGPGPLRFPLTHYQGDTFSFETRGENAVGRTGVTFKGAGTDGATVTVEYLDANGLGTFRRS